MITGTKLMSESGYSTQNSNTNSHNNTSLFADDTPVKDQVSYSTVPINNTKLTQDQTKAEIIAQFNQLHKTYISNRHIVSHKLQKLQKFLTLPPSEMAAFISDMITNTMRGGMDNILQLTTKYCNNQGEEFCLVTYQTVSFLDIFRIVMNQFYAHDQCKPNNVSLDRITIFMRLLAHIGTLLDISSLINLKHAIVCYFSKAITLFVDNQPSAIIAFYNLSIALHHWIISNGNMNQLSAILRKIYVYTLTDNNVKQMLFCVSYCSFGLQFTTASPTLATATARQNCQSIMHNSSMLKRCRILKELFIKINQEFTSCHIGQAITELFINISYTDNTVYQLLESLIDYCTTASIENPTFTAEVYQTICFNKIFANMREEELINKECCTKIYLKALYIARLLENSNHVPHQYLQNLAIALFKHINLIDIATLKATADKWCKLLGSIGYTKTACSVTQLLIRLTEYIGNSDNLNLSLLATILSNLHIEHYNRSSRYLSIYQKYMINFTEQISPIAPVEQNILPIDIVSPLQDQFSPAINIDLLLSLIMKVEPPFSSRSTPFCDNDIFTDPLLNELEPLAKFALDMPIDNLYSSRSTPFCDNDIFTDPLSAMLGDSTNIVDQQQPDNCNEHIQLHQNNAINLNQQQPDNCNEQIQLHQNNAINLNRQEQLLYSKYIELINKHKRQDFTKLVDQDILSIANISIILNQFLKIYLSDLGQQAFHDSLIEGVIFYCQSILYADQVYSKLDFLKIVQDIITILRFFIQQQPMAEGELKRWHSLLGRAALVVMLFLQQMAALGCHQIINNIISINQNHPEFIAEIIIFYESNNSYKKNIYSNRRRRNENRGFQATIVPTFIAIWQNIKHWQEGMSSEKLLAVLSLLSITINNAAKSIQRKYLCSFDQVAAQQIIAAERLSLESKNIASLNPASASIAYNASDLVNDNNENKDSSMTTDSMTTKRKRVNA